MSKNVFFDLGFSEEEAAGLKLKSFLLLSLQEAISNSGKNQTEIASVIGAGKNITPWRSEVSSERQELRA